jgi:polysaccharide deacetylase family protein (PEP-CTERM system associated)
METNKQNPVKHALSFDIEDWFHMVDIPSVADPAKWDQLPTLVDRYTRWILDTINAANVKATFFMLGWVAERHPQLAPLIVSGGHEIACHSYWHRRVDQLSRDEFREDTSRTKTLLEQQTGQPVIGYRAQTFSITPGAEWAFDVLLDLGFRYDASLFPAKRAHGGYPCPQEAHIFTNTPSGRTIHELPMSALDMGPMRLPFSGGGYLRLLPQWFIRHGFNKFERSGIPVVTYLHPRDFAVDCPRVPMPLARKFKSYVGISTAQSKLKMLLANYQFSTCAEVAGVV